MTQSFWEMTDKMQAYDLWKLHDDREDFDNNHCPHGESLDDPCGECWTAREDQEAKCKIQSN